MDRIRCAVVFLCLAVAAGGCAYLGGQGPSVRMFPDIHDGVTEDAECLECHHPDSGAATPTPHPDFKGCLRCHDGAIPAS